MTILRTFCYGSLFGGTFIVLLPWLAITYLPACPGCLGDWRWLGLLPLALGIAIAIWCAVTFATSGRGTPAPFDPPRRLIVHGLYRYSRNPMYIGGLLMITGEAVGCGSLWLLAYGALLGLWFQILIVRIEEPAHARRFGDKFSEYAARTPRWFGKRQS